MKDTDRREFLAAAVATGALVPIALATGAPATAAPAPAAAPFPGIDDLALPPDVRADLEEFARPVLRDVERLSELPLDGVDLAFVFVPRA